MLFRSTRVPLDTTRLPGAGAAVAGGNAQGTGAQDVVLRPYDNVLVMQQTEWRPLQSVWITGEVRLPGKYVIRDKNERVRDLILRAGGLLPDASIEAAYYARSRAATTYQNAQDKAASALTRLGVDLRGVLQRPEDDNNLLLEGGDSLDIPISRSTVEVRGAVNLPTITVVTPGASLSSYLRSAGGISILGDLSRAYVIQPNGKIESRRSFLFFTVDPTPRPGSTVVVPPRDTTNSSAATLARSEERRVGKECRSRWSPYH